MNPERAGQAPLVTINIAVRNGEKYIRQCLDSVLAQTYDRSLIEINILDNDSSDSTREIAQSYKLKAESCELPKFTFIESKVNLGMWPGQEELLKTSHGKYIVGLSVDIILDPKFIEEAVRVMESDEKIGMLQAKILQYSLSELETENWQLKARTIDTCGFKIFKSRELNNIGHGEEDKGQYNKEVEIFGVEGAVPVFRRETIEDVRIFGEFADHEFFWYGDDPDIAWRVRLLGWKHIYAPSVIAYHDRQTTKNLGGSDAEFVKLRQTIPMLKRRLDYRNHILMCIKNDHFANFVRDFPYIAVRQFKLWVYFFVYEPDMFREFFIIAKLLPRMLKKRREVMKRARVSAKEIRRWFV